jgi:AcrR family transcriptional regulator
MAAPPPPLRDRSTPRYTLLERSLKSRRVALADTRERIVGASAELFRRQGYQGTGLKQIIAMAEAQFGSLYHFFPGGKEELAVEVVRWSGTLYQRLVEGILDAAPDIVTGVRDVFSGAGETLRQTDYADACPIETVALEAASTNEPIRRATAEVFERWIASGTERMAAAGLHEDEARRHAVALIAALEGAFVLSRALRSTEPLDLAGEVVATAVSAALPDHPPAPSPRR